MTVSFRVLALTLVGLLLAACGSSYGAGSPASTQSTCLGCGLGSPLSIQGGHLVGAGGRTLYLWSKDTGSTSMCSAACAGAWPPYTVSSLPTVEGLPRIGLSRRSDGTEQLTYDGHPLYYFSGDAHAGDTNDQCSQAFGGEWALVGPTGAALAVPCPASPSTSRGGYGHY